MAVGTKYRTLSREYEVTVLCFVAVLDVWSEVVRGLRTPLPTDAAPFAALIPLALIAGKVVGLYGLTNARNWGYRSTLGVYAISLVLDLGTARVTKVVFDAVILVQLLRKGDYFR